MIFVISDIHSSQMKMLQHEMVCEDYLGRALGDGDVFLVCGDLLGPRARTAKIANRIDKDFLEYLNRAPYRVLSLYGNHDRASRALKWEGQGAELPGIGPVVKVNRNVAYLLNGRAYGIADGDSTRPTSVLVLGGSSPHFAYLRPKADDFDPRRYMLHLNRMMFEAAEADNGYPDKFDLVLSHDAPESMLGKIGPARLFGGSNSSATLDEIRDELDGHYGAWLFGHHHCDFSLMPGSRCLYKNAAVVKDGEIVDII